jgi:hypothetical protein
MCVLVYTSIDVSRGKRGQQALVAQELNDHLCSNLAVIRSNTVMQSYEIVMQ